MIVIDQGNFHMKENYFKFTNTWEFSNSLKSAEFHVNRPVLFIRNLAFWSLTYSESPQNFRSYDILHDYVASILAENFYKNQVYTFDLYVDTFDLGAGHQQW